jgi:hypothetical protein
VRWVNVSFMGETKNARRRFVDKPETRILRGRIKGRWENNVKMYCKVVE